LSSDIALDQRWTLKLTGRYSHLVGDAADSPIVETESQFYGGVGLTYRFDVRAFNAR
jgi:outer membrane scaffolding protein for murein synthesis (MipA/OmpV family)